MLTLLFSCCAAKKQTSTSENFYHFKASNLAGKEVDMKTYQGKVVLVVNTASKCGFTPQFAGLETLYKKYKEQGLVVLGFPCNQFGKQDPGTDTEIGEFCTANYGVTFPMFAKIEVNGSNAHPLYKYLKNALGGTFGDSVKWNFTKFLIDRNGKPIKRFAPNVKPADMEDEIAATLKE
ncbi:MAG: glutathione peroxidase [Paludibacteraceae bacterium]